MVLGLFIISASFGQSADSLEVLYEAGFKFYQQQDLPKAVEKWEHALKIAKRINDSANVGMLLENLGNLYVNLSEIAVSLSSKLEYLYKASDYYTEAHPILFKLGKKENSQMCQRKIREIIEKRSEITKEMDEKKRSAEELIKLAHESKDYHDAISYREKAIKIYEELDNKKRVIDELTIISSDYKNMNDYKNEILYLHKALKIAVEIDDKKEVLLIQNLLGLAYDHLNDVTNAISYLEQALKLSKEIGDKPIQGNIYNCIGAVYEKIGDYAKTISYCEKALQTCQEIKDNYQVGITLLLLSEAYKIIGNYAKAISCREEALKIHRELGDNRLRGVQGVDNFAIGALYTFLGNFTKSISYFEQAKKIFGEVSNNNEDLELEFPFIGFYYFLAGDKTKAISFYEQGMKRCIELENTKSVGKFLLWCGSFYAYWGDYVKADSCFGECLKVYNKLGIMTNEAEIHIADTWFQKGEYKKAEETYLRRGDPKRLGQLNLAQGKYEDAIEIFEKLLKEYLLRHETESIFDIYVLLGKAYQGLNQYDKAKKW